MVDKLSLVFLKTCHLNLNLQFKHHTSGRKYSLHCFFVQPGDTKYVYHMSDDTTHNASFFHEVLEDLFIKWGIKDQHVMIKSDNAQSQ